MTEFFEGLDSLRKNQQKAQEIKQARICALDRFQASIAPILTEFCSKMQALGASLETEETTGHSGAMYNSPPQVTGYKVSAFYSYDLEGSSMDMDFIVTPSNIYFTFGQPVDKNDWEKYKLAENMARTLRLVSEKLK